MTQEELERQLVETIDRWDMGNPRPRFGTLVRQAMTLAGNRGADAYGKFLKNFSSYVNEAKDAIDGWARAGKEPLPRVQARTLDFIKRYFSP